MEMMTIEKLDQRNYEASKVLVLYSLTAGEDGHISYEEQHHSAYMTIHRIRRGQVCEGRAITKKQLLRLCQTVMPKLKARPLYLPPEVLSYNSLDGSVLVWWRPAGFQTVFFSKGVKIKSGRAPLPPLVFIFNQGEIRTLALKEDKRPTPETDIYFTPFFNDGCMGNAKVPVSVKPTDIKSLEDLFFQGAFNNHSSPTLNGTTGEELWTSLTKNGPNTFPCECLQRRGKLKDIIKEEE